MGILISFLIKTATSIEGAVDVAGKTANFDVSYLEVDIPDQEVKNDTLGVEEAISQVFSHCFKCINYYIFRFLFSLQIAN